MDHIIAVLVHLDVSEMPNSLLLPRWSKNARSRVSEYMENGPSCWDSMVTCRYWMLNDLCSEMCVLASSEFNDFVDVVDKVQSEILRLKQKRKAQEGSVRDPPMPRRTYFSRPGFDVYGWLW
ncbi:hypothetical protein PIB30_044079 [Stylosanthes scabra]|uniref:Uncharacterized protein n=1 Tax=Stylosanthes scabra TaxID=79078 RepID=A0ABU6XDG8_9FABA|nr:hypothetical protein [Stylosanthes scabra]